MEGGWQEMEAMADFIFLGSKTLAPWKESYVKPRQHFKKQGHHFADKSPWVKAMFFPLGMYR